MNGKTYFNKGESMSKKVFLVFGSKYRVTAGIAKIIGEVLSNSGAAVETLSASKIADVQKYDAVVEGSSVYVDMWHKRKCVRL